MINADLKSKWVVALRSGEYRQGDDGQLAELRRDETDIAYCCLGVLGAVCGVSAERMDGKAELGEIDLDDLLGPWSERGNAISFSVSDPNSHVTMQRKLAAMNDGGVAFAEIADWIEQNVTVDTADESTDETEGESK